MLLLVDGMATLTRVTTYIQLWYMNVRVVAN